MKKMKIHKTAVFMHDGAPPHFSNPVRLWLNETLPGRWIGREGSKEKKETKPPMVWPPYSPDLTPCDYFLWGHVKDEVYREGVPEDLKQLRKRIKKVFQEMPQEMVDNAVDGFKRRLVKCIEEAGGHVE